MMLNFSVIEIYKKEFKFSVCYFERRYIKSNTFSFNFSPICPPAKTAAETVKKSIVLRVILGAICDIPIRKSTNNHERCR